MSVVYPCNGVAGWDCFTAASQHHITSQENNVLHMASLGKDKNSKSEVCFLLSACCFCTTVKSKNCKSNYHKSGTICRLSAFSYTSNTWIYFPFIRLKITTNINTHPCPDCLLCPHPPMPHPAFVITVGKLICFFQGLLSILLFKGIWLYLSVYIWIKD